jgi:hypothetical protein
MCPWCIDGKFHFLTVLIRLQLSFFWRRTV